jgi:hypothetical protein
MRRKSYSLVGERHELLDESLLDTPLTLRANHISASFIESMNLLRRQISRDLPQISHDFIDEWLALASLKRDKMAPTLVRNLDESVASHVLDTCHMLARDSRNKKRTYPRESRA